MRIPLQTPLVTLLVALMAGLTHAGVIHDHGNFFENANFHAIDNYNEHFTPSGEHSFSLDGHQPEWSSGKVGGDGDDDRAVGPLPQEDPQPQTYDGTNEPTSVVEPSTLATLGAGILALGLIRRRRRVSA